MLKLCTCNLCTVVSVYTMMSLDACSMNLWTNVIYCMLLSVYNKSVTHIGTHNQTNYNDNW